MEGFDGVLCGNGEPPSDGEGLQRRLGRLKVILERLKEEGVRFEGRSHVRYDEYSRARSAHVNIQGLVGRVRDMFDYVLAEAEICDSELMETRTLYEQAAGALDVAQQELSQVRLDWNKARHDVATVTDELSELKRALALANEERDRMVLQLADVRGLLRQTRIELAQSVSQRDAVRAELESAKRWAGQNAEAADGVIVGEVIASQAAEREALCNGRSLEAISGGDGTEEETDRTVSFVGLAASWSGLSEERLRADLVRTQGEKEALGLALQQRMIELAARDARLRSLERDATAAMTLVEVRAELCAEQQKTEALRLGLQAAEERAVATRLQLASAEERAATIRVQLTTAEGELARVRGEAQEEKRQLHEASQQILALGAQVAVLKDERDRARAGEGGGGGQRLARCEVLVVTVEQDSDAVVERGDVRELALTSAAEVRQGGLDVATRERDVAAGDRGRRSSLDVRGRPAERKGSTTGTARDCRTPPSRGRAEFHRFAVRRQARTARWPP